MGSREAVAYWQNLSGDLETAIAAEFVGRIDPAGKQINVDVDEISLNSPFATGATAETARLAGRVNLINPDGTNAAAYDVTATSAGRGDLPAAGQRHRQHPADQRRILPRDRAGLRPRHGATDARRRRRAGS